MEQEMAEQGEDYFQPSQYDETQEPNYYDEDILHQNEGWDASELTLDQRIERLRCAGERLRALRDRDLWISRLRDRDYDADAVIEKQLRMDDYITRNHPDERFISPTDLDFRREARKKIAADKAKAKGIEDHHAWETYWAQKAVYDYQTKYPRHQ
jgi:hypothetical protein